MFNRKILASLVVIGVVGAVAGSGTLAYFSDTETSEDNTFTAGSINAYFASVDGPITSAETFGDYFTEDGEDSTFLNVADMKPGDTNETTMAMAVTDNPSYLCLAVTETENNENQRIEPEESVDSTPNEGELMENLRMTAWVDDGDNQFSSTSDTDRVIVEDVPVPTGPTVYELVDSDYNAFNSNSALQPGEVRYVAVNVTLPGGTGNEAQTDSYVADLALYAVQERNNEDFQCENVDPASLGTTQS